MRRLHLFFLGIFLFPAVLHAGPIYGSLTEGGKGLRPATAIEIKCGDAVTKGETAKAGDGSYRINVIPQGQCSLTLPEYAGHPQIVVFSYANPAQYDFELVKRPDGNYELKKR